MNPVSDTAFYTCGIRAEDAASATPICHDHYAQRFMNAQGKNVFAQFSGDKMGSSAHIARHTLIDQCVFTSVSTNPNTTVITIGAGFDSRAYRTQGGRWFEIDELQIIEYKNERLATTACPNPLTRISIDFGTERLSEKLPQLAHDANVVVVIEGVFFYLTEEQISATLHALRTAYPHHVLVCDLMTQHIITSRYRRNNKKLQKMNAPFKFFSDNPGLMFTQNGYRVIEKTSIIKKAFELMWSKGIASFVARLLPKTASGYAVYTFEAVSAD